MARKRAEKPSWFKLFGDQEPLMQAMPDASVGAAVRGAMHYFNTGELPELTDPLAVAMFAMMRPHVEEAFEDFRRSVEAGKAAMEKRWGKKQEEGVRGLPPVIPGTIDAEAEADADAEAEAEADAGAGAGAGAIPSGPTEEQVRAYCMAHGFRKVDPQRFVEHFEKEGWQSRGSPVKDWKAMVRAWDRSRRSGPESGLDKLARLYQEEFSS